ncbi:MAG: ribose-5-phosphate isomerase RpiA [Methanosphaera sp.]|uniref:ribose-5-phosphate isomerase RpiA n=1 Tax=Methanosphaera sp. BMS TaxID=1789762 RepID=UPI000DC1C791|nr:ribose-5-phosphate isomerase RpiA [Methanosphaera sp. BMS]AWX33571.1 ribose-5-phosphate isomerase [Methanosphaera sp. BMS]MBQ6443444.1 ribose-5-phosphate isomerase RpiA [Methanosphaera sp.]
MDLLKQNVGKQAAALIEDGQVVGLGTGSTTVHFIKFLGQRVQDEQLDIMGIPTSFQSLILARELGIEVTSIDEHDIDIAVDGADEVSSNLDLIKGGGAAHTKEKIIDASADKFVVIVDESKMVDKLGAFPLPIEIIPESLRLVKNALLDMNVESQLRMGIQKDGPVITDNGNFILDASFNVIENPSQLEVELNSIPGVVENGIFSNVVDKVIVGRESGIEVINKEDI